MAKSEFEKLIESATEEFALTVVEAIKGATLQELVSLQENISATPRPGPGRPRGRKPGPQTASTEAAPAKPTRKKRVVKNYPKCAFPGCENNRFPRGKGYCGDHWRQWQSKKIKGAKFYLKEAAK